MSTTPPIVLPSILKLLIVIDTAAVQTNYPDPSQNPSEPIEIDEANWYVICSRNFDSGQENVLNYPSLQANSGDAISFAGISIDGDSGDSVILYSIDPLTSPHKRPQVFKKFQVNCLTREWAVQVNPATSDGMPPIHLNQNFICLDSTIRKFRNEELKVSLAVYNLDGDGQQQNLYGYFYFIVNVAVNNLVTE